MRHHLFLAAVTITLITACSSTGQRTGSVTKTHKPDSPRADGFFILSDPAASIGGSATASDGGGATVAAPTPAASSDEASRRVPTIAGAERPSPSLENSADELPVEPTEQEETSGDQDESDVGLTPPPSGALNQLSTTLRRALRSPSIRLGLPGSSGTPTVVAPSSSEGASGQSTSSLSDQPSPAGAREAASSTANGATKSLSSETSSALSRPASSPSSPSNDLEPRTTAEVLRAVSSLRGLSGWTIVPFAHFQRGARHVVVGWPAINSSGRLVDATVVGVCLEEGQSGLEECGRRWAVNDVAASRAAVVDALGGTDFSLRTRTVGTPLDELGPRLSGLGANFTQAVSRGDRNGALEAATAFVRMLPVDRVAYTNDVAQLLYMAAAYNGRLDHEGTVQNGDTATLTFTVRRGIIPVQTITATARRVNGSSDRWVLESYR